MLLARIDETIFKIAPPPHSQIESNARKLLFVFLFFSFMLIFLKDYFYLCVYVWVYVKECHVVCTGACGGQKTMPTRVHGAGVTVNCPVWALETEPASSESAVDALNH